MEKVILSVYWPDEWKSVEIDSSEWRKILRGKPYSDFGKGFRYDGVKFNDFWEFNNEIKGSCMVTYDEGCVGFEGSISECEIKEVETRKYLILDDFLTYYESFVNIPTWTKQKHAAYERLRNYLKSCRSDNILSSRDNSSTIVTYKNSFTIIHVDEKKNGILKQYRGKWVLMFMAGRDVFKHHLEVYPLKSKFDESFNHNFKNRFGLNYKDSITK
ncbi:MAG: hypothetical protein RIT38_208 [Bacteroidota bacterium]|jgi:hypothetical protein